MSFYIQQLNAAVEQKRAQRAQQRAEKEHATKQDARERLTPLHERLARLLATIPIKVKDYPSFLCKPRCAAARAATAIPLN
jgi:hypothetical protein